MYGPRCYQLRGLRCWEISSHSRHLRAHLSGRELQRGEFHVSCVRGGLRDLLRAFNLPMRDVQPRLLSPAGRGQLSRDLPRRLLPKYDQQRLLSLPRLLRAMHGPFQHRMRGLRHA